MRDKGSEYVMEQILRSPNIDPLFKKCLQAEYDKKKDSKDKSLMVDRDLLEP